MPASLASLLLTLVSLAPNIISEVESLATTLATGTNDGMQKVEAAIVGVATLAESLVGVSQAAKTAVAATPATPAAAPATTAS